MTKIKKQPKSLPTWILPVTILAVIVLCVVGFFTLRYTHPVATTPSPVATPVRGNTTHDEPSATPTPVSSSPTPIASSAPKPVTKPTLTKSSGNAVGSSVPAAAVVEFTCEGTLGAACDIVLTDRNNASHQVKLGSKTIADNSRGQYFAVWDWTAVSGSWNVTAVSSNPGVASVSSDAQTLEVRP